MTALAEMNQTFSEVGPSMNFPTLVAEWANSAVAVTRFSSDNPRTVTAKHLEARDGYVLAYHLDTLPPHEHWNKGVHAMQPGTRSPALKIFDLRTAQSCRLHGTFDNLFIYIPRAALDDVADAANAPRIEHLRTPEGWTTDDTVMEQAGTLLRHAMEQPSAASGLFTGHLLMALTAHVAQRYGGLREGERRATGGLAPWQERRAKDLLAANLSNPPSVGTVADEVGLSPSHFARAFKASIGRSPHAWLQEVRVDHAKDLLADPEISLAAVAMESGFADQSHFTRIFGRMTGATPGRWRADRRTG